MNFMRFPFRSHRKRNRRRSKGKFQYYSCIVWLHGRRNLSSEHSIPRRVKSAIGGDRIEERLHTEIAMAQASYPTTGFSLPEGYRSLREAAMMFLKAFPNRDLSTSPTGTADGWGGLRRTEARERNPGLRSEYLLTGL